MTAWVGTSGWQYTSWRGRLYPKGLPTKRWLEHYATAFPTVEVNASFYRLPREDAVRGWRDTVAADFVFAVKASRYLTHIRRLQQPEEPVRRLMSTVAPLESTLGPVLLQLPPTLRCEPDRLDETLACFPPGSTSTVTSTPSSGLRWRARGGRTSASTRAAVALTPAIGLRC
jgi:uncharacterized protein YecE (DUF72 family)